MPLGKSSSFPSAGSSCSGETGLLARLLRALRIVAALVLLAASPASAAASPPAGALEYVSEAGYVFGRSTGEDGTVLGFLVSDEGGLAFWSGYQSLGGQAVLGPAISHRFPCGEAVCQAFEQALLRWEPAVAEAQLVDVLSVLHDAGQDPLLASKLRMPPPWDWTERTAGLSQEELEAEHAGLYAASDGLADLAATLGSSLPTVVGRPLAVHSTPAGAVLRGTRGALVDPSTVDARRPAWVLGAGTIARVAGMIPEYALRPAAMPPSAASLPGALAIPKLNLTRALTPLDPEPDGTPPAPERPEEVAWYTDSAKLGEGGNMLLAGHVDWVGAQAVFRNLTLLEPDDEVWVSDVDGVPTQYRVVETGWFTSSSGLLLRYMGNPRGGPPTLTLVTCGGPFDLATRTYAYRFVVRAVPAG